MLRKLRENRAQAVFGEYLLVFFVIVSVMTGIALYFRRAVQGRIYDARNVAFLTVKRYADGFYVGNLYVEYEPYYTNTITMSTQDTQSNTYILPSVNSSGIFRKNISDRAVTRTTSYTAPPAASNGN